MGRLLAVLLLAGAAALPARAQDPWTKADTGRELAYVAVATLDWGTTLDIAHDYDCGRDRFEQNPLLGRHPSRAKINVLIPAGMLLHYLIARSLPAGLRRVFQYTTLVIEVSAVSHNYAIGLKLNF